MPFIDNNDIDTQESLRILENEIEILINKEINKNFLNFEVLQDNLTLTELPESE
jgi:hypothetical protein